MNLNKNYAVFGLGKYGRAVVKELLDNGAKVLAVDKNQKTVDELVGEIPNCKCADVTEYGVIKNLGIADFDVVVLAMSENFEACVMATVLCKELGVKKVIVKCENEIHYSVLERIGADEVVFPERDSGVRLAKNLLSSGFIDLVDLSDDISLLERVPKPEWIGKSLKELDLRKKYNINIIAIKIGENINISVTSDTILEENMKIILIADKNVMMEI